MSTPLNITVKSLIGAKPFFDLDPSANPDIAFPSGVNKDNTQELLDGSEVVIEKVIHERIDLAYDPLEEADQSELRQIRNSRQDVAVCPPWTEDAIEYFGLQADLTSMREPLTPNELTMTRKCRKANSVTGAWSDFDVPVHGNCGPGQGLHVGNVVDELENIDFTFQAFLTADATDAGATTLITVSVADAVALDDYMTANDDIFMISTKDQATNTFEVFEIDSINTTTGVITASTVTGGAASAALAGTTNFTKAKKCYITAVSFVSDWDMEDEGVGSWADQTGPALKVKTKTMQETGSRALRVIGGAANAGTTQQLGDIPTGTNLYVLARIKVVRGVLQIVIRNTSDSVNELTEAVSDGSYTTYLFAFQVSGVGNRGIALRFQQSGGVEMEILVDRASIFKNRVQGGMEGTYADESGGGGGTIDVAPGWDELNCELNVPAPGPDLLDEDADEHGGDKAQRIFVDTSGEGIITTAAPFAADVWFIVGAHFKVAGGGARVREDGVVNIITDIDDVDYTFRAAAYQADGANDLSIVATTDVDADFLVDDVCVIKLMGNPHVFTFGDLSEELSTDGFTIFGIWQPDVANTALTADAYLFWGSTRTSSASNTRIFYDESNADLNFFVKGAGTDKSVDVAETFSAGDSIIFAARVRDGVDMDIFVKIGSASITSDTTTDAAIDIDGGMTRAWFGTHPTVDGLTCRGPLSAILIENTALSDADITALIDRMSQDDWLNVIKSVDGIQYQVQGKSHTPYSAQADKLLSTLSLKERKRNLGAVIANQD